MERWRTARSRRHGRLTRHAVVLALLGALMPQPAGVDAPGWATPWSATTASPSGTTGLAWNSYGTTVVNDGGVDFFWRFSDSGGGFNATVGGYNGSYVNSPSYLQPSAQGGSDKSVYFNGSNQYAMVSNNSQYAMNNTQAYSFEIIFKLTSLPSSGNPRLLSHSDLGSGAGGWEVGYNGTSDPNAGQVYCARFPASGQGSAVYGGSNGYTLTVGQWVHLVCTFDGSTLRFYWNGELRSTGAASGNINDNGKNLYFGSLGGTSQYINGYLDEVGIYWNALSAREVKSHYYAMLAKL